jgi:hypothetical protein
LIYQTLHTLMLEMAYLTLYIYIAIAILIVFIYDIYRINTAIILKV